MREIQNGEKVLDLFDEIFHVRLVSEVTGRMSKSKTKLIVNDKQTAKLPNLEILQKKRNFKSQGKESKFHKRVLFVPVAFEVVVPHWIVVLFRRAKTQDKI